MNKIDKLIKALPIAQKLFDRETFTAAAEATGRFDPDSLWDSWRLGRNSQWCDLCCLGKWRRTACRRKGVVTFEFEDADDAENFRRETGRSPTLIHCR